MGRQKRTRDSQPGKIRQSDREVPHKIIIPVIHHRDDSKAKRVAKLMGNDRLGLETHSHRDAANLNYYGAVVLIHLRIRWGLVQVQRLQVFAEHRTGRLHQRVADQDADLRQRYGGTAALER